jgi:aminopeptidase N
MAHPIRPESYIAMDNFYTATVYEKGSEVMRMYETLLGKEGFRKGTDLYFERHDGQAVTCDDFRAAMSDANAHPDQLAQFERWYTTAGTPEVKAVPVHDALAATHGARVSTDIYTRGMPLVPTPARFKLLQACDQWHSSRVSTFLTG